jgi:hypothetical protein
LKKAWIAVIVLLMMNGCTSKSENAIEKDPNTSELPIEKDTHYEIYDISRYNSSMYQYFIFNDEKKVLESNVALTYYPEISDSQGLVKIMGFAGTGVFYCYFVNTETGEISDVYYTPFANSEMYVAIFNRKDLQIEVYNIFGGTIVNQYKRDFDNQMADFTMEGTFSKDNETLTVTYLDSNRNEVTEDFKLH